MSEPLLHPRPVTLVDELAHLRRIVADMGELVDAAITQATTGLAARDVSLRARVIAHDPPVNARQRDLREPPCTPMADQRPHPATPPRPTAPPNPCSLAHGFAAMGIALPGALAAKLVFPQRKVIAVNGDGGFLMNAQELETARRMKTAFPTVVWKD